MATVYYDNDVAKMIQRELDSVRENPVDILSHSFVSREDIFDILLDIVRDQSHTYKAEIKEALKALDITKSMNDPSQEKPLENLMRIFIKDENCLEELMNAYEEKMDSCDWKENEGFKKSLHNRHEEAKINLSRDGIIDGKTPVYIVYIDGEEPPTYVGCKKVVVSSIDDIEEILNTSDDYEVRITRESEKDMYLTAYVEGEDLNEHVYFLVPEKWVEFITKTSLIRRIIDFITNL